MDKLSFPTDAAMAITFKDFRQSRRMDQKIAPMIQKNVWSSAISPYLQWNLRDETSFLRAGCTLLLHVDTQQLKPL
eukprot:1146609-Pelagomonas_calceolata.AAC.5